MDKLFYKLTVSVSYFFNNQTNNREIMKEKYSNERKFKEPIKNKLKFKRVLIVIVCRRD
jgi:hypothetical protein